jgi:vesicle-fusing ATPase
VFIGVKKLLALIDMVKQTPENMRVIKFLTKMEEDGGLITPTTMQ